jgi:multiple sugar transport system ATP-binding protein
MVFQDYALFPHMTIEDNVAYPLKIQRRPRAARIAHAHEVGSQLGLDGLMLRRPAELSGGQQQRVALARAVACHPAAFLFDEPLSNLDARLRLEARTFLKRFQRELGVTTVFVTHDQAEALALADRIAVMEAGRIRQIGTPREVFGRPANTFVANFIGSTPMNLLPGVVSAGSVLVAGQRVHTREGLLDGEVVVGVRPEYVTVGATGPLSGEVSTVEHLGTSSLVTADVDGLSIGAVVPEDYLVEAGERVALTPTRVLIYRDGELVP